MIVCSGRVEKEILESTTSIKRDPPEFSRITSRSLSFRLKSSGLSSSQSSSQDGNSGFPTLPRAKHSTPILVVDSLEEEPVSEVSSVQNETYHASSLPHTNESNLTPVEEDHEPIGGSFSSSASEVNESFGSHHPVVDSKPSSPETNHIFDQPSEDCGPVMIPSSEIHQTNVTGFIPLFTSQEPCGPPPSPRSIIAFKLVVPTLFFAVFFLSCIVIVILESDSELLSDVRRMPEVIILRREYYEPFKEYLKKTINSIWKR